MKAKNVNQFRKGIEPKRSLGIGISPKDWAGRVVDELKKYGIETRINQNPEETFISFSSSFTKEGQSEIENNGIWIEFFEDEWDLISGTLQKTILVIKDKNIDELIKEIVAFEYENIKEYFFNITSLLNKEG